LLRLGEYCTRRLSLEARDRRATATRTPTRTAASAAEVPATDAM